MADYGEPGEAPMNLNMSPPTHIPVLLQETVEALAVQPGGRYIDCTLGSGRHAAAILERSSPGGQLLGIDADPKALLNVKLKPGDVRLLQGTNHYQNFIDAVRLRTTPASPIDSAVQLDFVSHLSDMAVRTARKIRRDPVKEVIVGDKSQNRLLRRPTRRPWRL
mgnify:CR=1 FL=1